MGGAAGPGGGPTARLERKHGRTHVTGLQAEEWVARLTQQLMPMLDRVNRQLLRNLRALRELKGATLALRVENYGQMNVGQTQTNQAGDPAQRRASRRAAKPNR